MSQLVEAFPSTREKREREREEADEEETMDGRANPLSNINDIELHDFLVDPNFDQFINLIRGDQSVGDPVPGFDMGSMNSCFIDQHQFGSVPAEELFDELPDFDSHVAESLPSFEGESVKAGDDDYNDCEDSSATTTNLSGRKSKTDRSRTLISERRRRGRMKEKLYALRSLVPNITKMDKASIVGDAVLYVQQLQSQAKKLKAEIAGLEVSLNAAERYQETTIPYTRKNQGGCDHNLPVCKKIIQMDVIQVEEKGFYVRLVCNKGQGVAPSLYKSLESLTSFHVRNSNLTSSSADRYLLTFTLDGTRFEQSLNLPNLKLWITGCLLNQGFEFVTPVTS